MAQPPSANTGAILWTPSEARVRATWLDRFRRRMEAAHGALPDYHALWRWSVAEPEAFWCAVWDDAGLVGERGDLVVRDRERMPGARWFPEARLNFAENLLRRRDDSPALVFRGEHGVRRELSWRELHGEVARWRAAFDAVGLTAGDRVAAWLPNLPEAVAVLLAATSLGATFTSCSPDFGARGVLDRFGQVEPRLLVAVDGYFYAGKRHDVLPKLAEVVAALPSVERTVVVPYAGGEASLDGVRDAVWQDDFLAGPEPARLAFAPLPFDHPLYVLYSSGTTGPPKCIVHGAGGTLLQHVKEHRLHADVHPGDGLFYFTTLGWMMWNWLVSGLASEATLHLYDGSPFHPAPTALFDLAEQERTAILGTSAKYLDAAKKAGLDPARSHDLGSVRTILSTGSPLAPESFDWVYEHVKADVQLASISGGTDIVSCFVAGDPTGPVRRGEIQARALGMAVDVFDDAGRPVRGQTGELVCTASFPSMPLGFWNDPDGARYRAAYFERFPGVWCHGDFVALTEHGGIVIHGRSDAVLNPGGVRIGTAEIYRQVEGLDAVEEALVVGQDWERDVRVVLFVKLAPGAELDVALADEIRQRIRRNASPRHVPAKILAVPDIPRTRSGKIVELAVREVVHGRPVKNREALSNPEALEHFRDRPELAS
ncbi:MAG TPA: acetoacetate--CoA ligase [Myxococcota bacterium]|nr:acetoacetate--CoA ligase [Myxococcota bacterium]